MQTFTGREYLAIDIASNFGLDKLTWQERIDWFLKNEHQLLDLLPQADNPALYYAGLLAWNDIGMGKPSGYPISLDATSSGLQILACLTGDRKAAELCNVVNKPLDFSPEAEAERRDGYTVIYNEMVSRIGEEGKIKRPDVKQAIMTALYGSTAIPKEVFGEGQLLTIFEETMNDMAPGAWELNKKMLELWNPEALEYNWVMPDNFHVKTKVMNVVSQTVHFLNEPFEIHRKVNAPTDEGRSLGANMTHSIDGMIVREMTRRCSFDPLVLSDVNQLLHSDEVVEGTNEDNCMVETLWKLYEESGFLSARILEHLSSENYEDKMFDAISALVNSMPAKPFDLICVHDCFRCLPNYGNDLRKQYMTLLAELAKSEMLSYLISQIIDRKVKIGKIDPNLHEDILDAEYALS